MLGRTMWVSVGWVVFVPALFIISVLVTDWPVAEWRLPLFVAYLVGLFYLETR
jgi:hypothetical protein